MTTSSFPLSFLSSDPIGWLLLVALLYGSMLTGLWLVDNKRKSAFNSSAQVIKLSPFGYVLTWHTCASLSQSMWQGFVDMVISLSQSKLILRAKHRLFLSKSHDWKIQGTIQQTKSKNGCCAHKKQIFTSMTY